MPLHFLWVYLIFRQVFTLVLSLLLHLRHHFLRLKVFIFLMLPHKSVSKIEILGFLHSYLSFGSSIFKQFICICCHWTAKFQNLNNTLKNAYFWYWRRKDIQQYSVFCKQQQLKSRAVSGEASNNRSHYCKYYLPPIVCTCSSEFYLYPVDSMSTQHAENRRKTQNSFIWIWLL